MMETYCVSYNKNTANKNLIVKKIKQDRLIVLSNYVVCGKKKPRFIEQ